MKRTIIQMMLWFSVVICAAFLGYMSYEHGHVVDPKTIPALQSGSILSPPKVLGPFRLTRVDGSPFTNENLKGHWTLLFFGFTSCPSLCPTTLTTLTQLMHRLSDMHVPLPEVVFISVDPKRDTLERIRTYVQGFNSAFVGVTGSDAELHQVSKQLGVMYQVIPMADGNYMVDHTGSILVIDPSGAWHAVFTMPHQVEHLASDMRTLSTAHTLSHA